MHRVPVLVVEERGQVRHDRLLPEDPVEVAGVAVDGRRIDPEEPAPAPPDHELPGRVREEAPVVPERPERLLKQPPEPPAAGERREVRPLVRDVARELLVRALAVEHDRDRLGREAHHAVLRVDRERAERLVLGPDQVEEVGAEPVRGGLDVRAGHPGGLRRHLHERTLVEPAVGVDGREGPLPLADRARVLGREQARDQGRRGSRSRSRPRGRSRPGRRPGAGGGPRRSEARAGAPGRRPRARAATRPRGSRRGPTSGPAPRPRPPRSPSSGRAGAGAPPRTW